MSNKFFNDKWGERKLKLIVEEEVLEIKIELGKVCE